MSIISLSSILVFGRLYDLLLHALIGVREKLMREIIDKFVSSLLSPTISHLLPSHLSLNQPILISSILQ